MDQAIHYNIPIEVSAIVFFALTLLFCWLGQRFKQRKLRLIPIDSEVSLGSLGGSMMGLTSLLFSFTFSATYSKFENRRALIVAEANDIGKSIVLCGMYPDSVKRLFLADFKDYVNARTMYYDVGDDALKIQETLRDAVNYSDKIFNRAILLSQYMDNRVRSGQMIPALNNMTDIVTTREAIRQAYVPRLIVYVLIILNLTSAFLIGFDRKAQRSNMIGFIAFALMTTLVFYLIDELDKTRQGFITLNAAEKEIEALRYHFINVN